MTGRCLYLDFDGTLADSLAVMRDIYIGFLEQLGVEGSENEFKSLIGPPIPQIISTLKTRHNLPHAEEALVAIYNSIIENQYLGVLPALGATQLLDVVKSKDWLLALVTSNKHSVVSQWLADNELTDYFDVLVTAEDVKQGKPNPEPYLAAIEKTQCEAARSFAVEDSPQGAIAATAAGLSTFGICELSEPQLDWPSNVTFVRGLSGLAEILKGES